MTEITYTCKFCRSVRIVEADVSAVEPARLQSWLKILACNPCADFERVRLDLVDGGVRYATALIRARSAMTREKLPAFETQIIERLTGLTKKYAMVVCRHLHVPIVWEYEFVAQIMEQPEKVKLRMDMYYRLNRQKQPEMAA